MQVKAIKGEAQLAQPEGGIPFFFSQQQVQYDGELANLSEGQ